MIYLIGELKTKGFLLDTNIFLEIMLNQQKKNLAKKVIEGLMRYSYSLHMSDFTLHTIGIKFWDSRKNPKPLDEKRRAWESFLNDIFPETDIRFNILVVSLTKRHLHLVGEVIEKYNLDFDDAYQVALAMKFGLDIISEDDDLKRLCDCDPPPVRIYTLTEITKILGI